jgi:hypothetical protein
MPSSVGTSLLVLGAVVTTVSGVGGVVVATLGLLWELGLFVWAGINGDR